MAKQIPFKTRVKQIAIAESKKYKDLFIDHQYLICSKKFQKRDYYIISGEKDNFLHLVGINTYLSAAAFLINAMMEHLQKMTLILTKEVMTKIE